MKSILTISKVFLSILLTVILLSGCTEFKPVPADKKDYIGNWYGDNMSLLITAEGRLVYDRKTEFTTESLDGPIQEFENDHITAGYWIINMTFQINRLPHKEGDAWKMGIDGVTLTKQPQVGSLAPKPASDVPA